jgi:hypothetical protein
MHVLYKCIIGEGVHLWGQRRFKLVSDAGDAVELRLSPACQNCRAAMIADVSNTRSVCTFEPHRLSGLLIGP